MPLQTDGFSKHPKLDIWLNTQGDVFDNRKKALCSKRLNRWTGYLCVDVLGSGTHYVHRLMAETFLVPKSDDQLIVNHKDGNKLNNLLSNLEWVSYSQNILHAYDNGLRKDNVRLNYKNLRTNETGSFITLKRCADFLGINPAYISYWLKETPDRPVLNELIFWKSGEKPNEEKYMESYLKDSNGLFLVCQDNVTYLFNSIIAISVWFNITQKEILDSFSQMGSTSVIKNELIIRVLKHGENVKKWDIDCREDGVRYPFAFRKRNAGNKNGRKPSRVLCHDLQTDISFCCHSLLDFSKLVNGTPSSIQKSIHLNAGRWKHYHLTYIRKVPTISDNG